MSSLGNFSNNNASLGNINGIDISGSGSIVTPPFDNELNPVNKAYTDQADAVLQSQITTISNDLDGFPDQLKQLDTAEINQLENIGAVTIDNTQWGYVGGLDQGLSSTDSVAFSSVQTGGVELLSPASLGATALRTTDPNNTLRILKNGDLRFYNPSNVLTLGMNFGVLEGFDNANNKMWSWFTNRPATDTEIVFQTRNVANTATPLEFKRDGDINIRNVDDILTNAIGYSTHVTYDNDGDAISTDFFDTTGGDSAVIKQIKAKTGVVTYDLKRNGDLIMRRPDNATIFDFNTATAKLFINGELDVNNIQIASGTEINDNGLCVKSSGGNECLIHVLDGGTTFDNQSGVRRATINDSGLTVLSSGDVVISGGASLADTASTVATNSLSIAGNSANIATAVSLINTNTTNISTLSTDVAGKLDGIAGTQRILVGNTASYPNLSQGVLITSGTTSTENDFNQAGSEQIVIEGSLSNTPMVFNGTQNVVIGQMTGSNRTLGSNNVRIGYGVAGNGEDNSVVIGNNLTSTSAGNTNTVIGNSNSWLGSENIIFGFNNDILSTGIRNIIMGTSAIIGAGSNQVINVGSQSSSTGSQLTTLGIGNGNRGTKNVQVGNLNTAITSGGFDVNNVLQIGNNLTSRADNNLTFGDNIVVDSAGIYFQQVFETLSGGGSDVVFESIAGGISKLGSIVSSRRHKEEIMPLEESEFNSADIYKVIPKRFKYKERKGYHVGVIAEDYLKMDSALLRDLVVWGEEEGVDESEPRNEIGMTVKSFNYRGLIVPMVAEMKKMKTEIDTLKKQNKTILEILKNKNLL